MLGTFYIRDRKVGVPPSLLNQPDICAPRHSLLYSRVNCTVYRTVYSVLYICCSVHDKYVEFSHTCRVVTSKSVKTQLSICIFKMVKRQRRQILKISNILKFTFFYLPGWGANFHENNSFCLQSFGNMPLKRNISKHSTPLKFPWSVVGKHIFFNLYIFFKNV